MSTDTQIGSWYICERCNAEFDKMVNGKRSCPKCGTDHVRKLRESDRPRTICDGFLEAIIATPEDDAVRLIYADWLTENGHEERGELIRCQCELAKPLPTVEVHVIKWQQASEQPKRVQSFTVLVNRKLDIPDCCTLRHQQRDDTWIELRGMQTQSVDEFDSGRVKVVFQEHPRFADLRKRERELFDRGDDAADWTFDAQEGIPPRWLRGLEFIEVSKPQVAFRRGFVSSIQCDSAAWLAHGPTIARLQPLESVTLSDWEAIAAIDSNDFDMDQFEMQPARFTPTDGYSLHTVLCEWSWLPTLHDTAAEALSVFSHTLIQWARAAAPVVR